MSALACFAQIERFLMRSCTILSAVDTVSVEGLSVACQPTAAFYHLSSRLEGVRTRLVSGHYFVQGTIGFGIK